MKIFGWMHKKLHLGTTEYHRVAHRNSPDVVLGDESGGKRGAVLAARVKEWDTEALLLPHVLLTIGTFGHHHNPHQQITQLQEEQEPLSSDHEQDLKPAAIKQDSAPNPTATATAAFLHSESISKPAESAAIEQGRVKKQEVPIEEEITSQEPLLKENKEKIERRTTLADLFAAETARGAGESPDAARSLSANKRQTTTCPTKNATKTTDKEKELPTSAAADCKKIHRLITRMLKKRIHPDLLARAGEERNGRKGVSDDGGEEKRRVNYRLPGL